MPNTKADAPARFDFNAEPWAVDRETLSPFGFFTEKRDFAAAVDFALQNARRAGHKFPADADFLNEIRAIQIKAIKAALTDFFYKRALKSLESHAAANDFGNAWESHQRKLGKSPDPAKCWENFI